MSLPTPETSNNGTQKRPPFLKVKDIAKKGRTKILLTGAPIRIQEGRFGTQAFVEVKNGNKIFTFPIKLDGGNYRILFDRFGKDERKWKGPIQVERDEYLGNEYVKVCD